ncbi:MAG: hypothetical protein KJO20_06990 [Eudoraea sp.]|nr:hypothetical protein [Eudoraea sp.]NNK30335.1 hypothetical protein [Flavobacteriaceae bacterium]
MRSSIFTYGLYLILFTGVLQLSGCAVSKQRKYQREYRRLWKEIIQSQAWKEALRSSKTFSYVDSELRYMIIGPSDLRISVLPDTEKTRGEFEERYRKWVNGAYYRIIAEAEKADARIKQEYEEVLSKRKLRPKEDDPDFRESLILARRRYQAHRKMLEGLKSWKAFEEYGSDDLDFFGEENKSLVYELFRTGQNERTITAYLMYKLADLYHQDQ